MTDEHQKARERERAALAQQLVDHPLWAEAWEEHETQLMEQWRLSKARDTEGRENIWLMLKIGQKVRKRIEKHIETGKLVALEDELENVNG